MTFYYKRIKQLPIILFIFVLVGCNSVETNTNYIDKNNNAILPIDQAEILDVNKEELNYVPDILKNYQGFPFHKSLISKIRPAESITYSHYFMELNRVITLAFPGDLGGSKVVIYDYDIETSKMLRIESRGNILNQLNVIDVENYELKMTKKSCRHNIHAVNDLKVTDLKSLTCYDDFFTYNILNKKLKWIHSKEFITKTLDEFFKYF